MSGPTPTPGPRPSLTTACSAPSTASKGWDGSSTGRYILGGPCVYTGRSMAEVHADTGLQPADFGALVEHMQTAMGEEGVSFRDQNRLLARLAPMKRDVVTR